MTFSENHFKKFLVDEIILSSHVSVKDALNEVNKFSETFMFTKAYSQWKQIKLKNRRVYFRPRSIQEILSGVNNAL